MHLDFKLTLGRNTVEAAAAGITLDVNHAEAVAGILSDTLECGQGACIDHRLQVLGLLTQTLLVLAGLAYDFLKLGAFLGQHVFMVGHLLFGGLDVAGTVLDAAVIFADMLFGQFDFEGLEFHLL